MKIPALTVSALSLVCIVISAPALAGSTKLKCSVVEDAGPKSQYELRVSNPGKKAVPAGATVHAKISPKKIQGVNPKTVNTDFSMTLKDELAGGGSTDIAGTPFAKSCTATATW